MAVGADPYVRWGIRMGRHDPFTDRGVSPVVGVILMVAITVLLAATAATFFMGITNDAKKRAPQAAIDFDYDASAGHTDDELTITHTSGDGLEADNVEVVVSDAEAGGTTVAKRITWSDFAGAAGSEVSAGSAVVVDEGEFGASTLSLEGATVKVVWNDPGGSGSIVLANW